MNKKQAVRMAIEALMYERKKYIFNANLFHRGVDTICTRRDYEKCAKFNEAIEILKKEATP